ncbi:apolipoprotein N-acyltransferase [Thiomonas intermedia]|uniref:apolipoprotein N-acyltransferase n=1 Tax=Thiomonas intermedia TaxID=926 RepID=UPI0009A554E2|nr:apolipoprotein N-acyltransferase [Thiomonas intermedia]
MPAHPAPRDRHSARPRSRLGRLLAHPRLAPFLSILLGGLLAQTFGRPQFGAWSILILALWIGLLWADPQSTRSKRAKRGALLGFSLGLGWFTGGLWWLYISMAVYGGMSPPLAGGALLLFCAYLAIYPTLAAALAAALAPPARREPWPLLQALGSACVLAGGWTLAEWLRGTVFTGFPWLALGYAQVGNPLSGYAPVVGQYGVNFAAALAAALLALLSQVSLRGALVNVALLAALFLGGLQLQQVRWTHPVGPALRVALLQGDVAQSEKFRPDSLAPTLRLYGDWLSSLHADLIVTPETAVPVLPEDLDPSYLRQVERSLREHHAAALLGIPLTRGTDQYTNSVLGLGGTAPYRYDKAHLVPFGEFVPYGFHWFVKLMDMPLGSFARGGFDQPPFVVQGVKVAPNICYEDLFGAQMAQRFRSPGHAPNLFANLTNLGWFGNTIVIPQHLEIARMRSLEFQIPGIRATNTGATALIDARGRVAAELPPYTVGVLNVTVQGHAGLTPFAWAASRYGDWPEVLLALFALLLGWALARPQRGGTRHHSAKV